MPKCKIQEHDIQCNWKKTTSKIFFFAKNWENRCTKKDQNGKRQPTKKHRINIPVYEYSSWHLSMIDDPKYLEYYDVSN